MPNVAQRGSFLGEAQKLISVFLTPLLSYLVYPDVVETALSVLVLAAASPALASAQLILVALWTAALGSNTLGEALPNLLHEPVFRALQGAALAVVAGVGKHHATGGWTKPVARPLRNLFAAATVALLFSSLFRSVSPIMLGWAGATALFAVSLSREVARRQITLRGVLANATVLTASLAISLGLLEAGARLLLPEPVQPSDIYEPHPRDVFTLRPNGRGTFEVNVDNKNRFSLPVEISGQGIRDREYGPKQADEFRIVALGDSYTMGHGLKIEDTYERVLESMLNASGLPWRVSVVNCGVGGYAPWQERDFLQERGFGFEPDAVILQIFPGNDVSGSYSRAGGRLAAFDAVWERRFFLLRMQHDPRARFERWLRAHSYAYGSLLGMTESTGIALTLLTDFRLLPRLDSPRLARENDRNPYREICLVEWYPEIHAAWEMFEADIRGIRDDCRSRSVDLIAFCHSDWTSLRRQDWEVLNRKFSDTPYEWNKDIQLTRALFERLGIPYADVVSALLARSDPDSLYYKYDGHFTPEGARIIAECLFDLLSKSYFPQKLAVRGASSN